VSETCPHCGADQFPKSNLFVCQSIGDEKGRNCLERQRDQLQAEVARLTTIVDRLGRAEAIICERDRQDAKWRPQNHDLPTWLAILMEEVGELAAACLCHRFGTDDHPELDWRKEAIQVAAVALSMTEQAAEAAKDNQ